MLMLSSHLPGAANRLVRVSLIDSPLIFSSCKLCGCRRRRPHARGCMVVRRVSELLGFLGRWVSRFELWVIWDKQPLPCAAMPNLAPMGGWGFSPTGGRDSQVQTTASSAGPSPPWHSAPSRTSSPPVPSLAEGPNPSPKECCSPRSRELPASPACPAHTR